MLRKSSVFVIAAFVQLVTGQSLHAGRYFASAPVFSVAPMLPPGPGPAPCGAPPPLVPVANPPFLPPPIAPFAPPVGLAPPPAMPAAAPGLVPAAAPPSPITFAPGFAGAFGPGPFGSNKKNERHPAVEEDKPAMETQPMTEPPVTVDPNAPKLDAKRTVPVEFADNSTQPALQQETEKPTA